MDPMQIRLWPEGPDLLCDESCQKPGTDSVLLAGFAGPGNRIADLGCGCGTLALLLASARQNSLVTGLELDAHACDIARQAAGLNGLDQRVTILQRDLRDLSALPQAGSFDCAVSNPPYFPVGSGKPAPGQRRVQRSQESCSILEICRAAARLVRWGGSFSLVYRPEGLAELLWALRETRLEPKRLCFVRHHPAAAVSLVLVESRRGGGTGLGLEEVFLYDDRGRMTPEHCRFYHKELDL